MPPQDMPDAKLEQVNRLLARQNWTLIRNAAGDLVPVRMI